MNIERILRSVVFFEYVGEHHVQQMADMARSQTVETGEVVFSEGEAENHLYLIESGRIQISRDGPHFGRQTFALLGPGDHFGALSLFYSDPHFASAIAVEPTRLWIIRHDDFQASLQKQPKLAFAVVKGMVLGIRTANGEIRRLTTLFDQRSRSAIALPAEGRSIRPSRSLPPPAN